MKVVPARQKLLIHKIGFLLHRYFDVKSVWYVVPPFHSLAFVGLACLTVVGVATCISATKNSPRGLREARKASSNSSQFFFCPIVSSDSSERFSNGPWQRMLVTRLALLVGYGVF